MPKTILSQTLHMNAIVPSGSPSAAIAFGSANCKTESPALISVSKQQPAPAGLQIATNGTSGLVIIANSGNSNNNCSNSGSSTTANANGVAYTSFSPIITNGSTASNGQQLSLLTSPQCSSQSGAGSSQGSTSASSAPSHAVVGLRPQDDVYVLLRLLIENGYPDVSFLSNLSQDKLIGRTMAAKANVEKECQTDASIPVNSLLSSTISLLTTQMPTLSVPACSALVPPLTPYPQLTIAPLSAAAINQVAAVIQQPPLRSLIPASMMSLVSPNQLTVGTSQFNGGFPPLIRNGSTVSLTSPAISKGLASGGLLTPIASSSGSQTAVGEMGIGESADSPPTAPATPLTDTIRQRTIKTMPASADVAYIRCKLCNNPIMSNRYSNMINHVKRHATVKQFQCPYCNYQHNETAKVRLHMHHNHGDQGTAPIDRWTPDLQNSWETLMRQCFPDFHNPKNSTEDSPTPTSPSVQSPPLSWDGGPAVDVMGGTEPDASPMEEESGEVGGDVAKDYAACSECGEVVSIKAKTAHVRFAHLNSLPYTCSVCGYEQIVSKVIEHVQAQHGGDQEGTSNVLREVSQILHSLTDQCFPGLALNPKLDSITSSSSGNASLSAVPHDPHQRPLVPLGCTSNGAIPVGGDLGLSGGDQMALGLGGSVDGKVGALLLKAVQAHEQQQQQQRQFLDSPLMAGGDCSSSNNSVTGSTTTNDTLEATIASLTERSLHMAQIESDMNFLATDIDPRYASRRSANKCFRSDTLECLLCHRRIVAEPRQSLLNHAKRHCFRKQFKCPGCAYASSESAHVRNHMSAKHGMTGMLPIDSRNSTLEASWQIMLNRCFPQVKQKNRKHKQIEEFRLANGGRNSVGILDPETEELMDAAERQQREEEEQEAGDPEPVTGSISDIMNGFLKTDDDSDDAT